MGRGIERRLEQLGIDYSDLRHGKTFRVTRHSGWLKLDVPLAEPRQIGGRRLATVKLAMVLISPFGV